MYHVLAAYVFCVTAAAPRGTSCPTIWLQFEGGPGPATLTVSEGEVVTLEPPTGIERENAYWVEVSGPSVLLRKGEAPGPELRLRPRVWGRYRLACLSDEEGSLADAQIVELQVAGRTGRLRPIARIHAPLRGGAGEEVKLLGGPVSSKKAKRLAARWKQLSGPRVELRLTDGPSRASRQYGHFTPIEPGRYRFAVKVATERGRTPWATFTFEVPRRADGSADRRPVARVTAAGVPLQGAVLGREIVLDGSASFDPDGDELTHVWEQITGPRLGAASELAAEGPRVKLLPAFAGKYTFALTVVDPCGLESRPEPVAFEVVPPPRPPRPLAADPVASDPLDRPVSVLLEDAPLSALFSRLSDRGVTVRTAPELGDAVKLGAGRIDLWVVDLPARRVLDWLGRMLEAFYVVEGPGSVWFTRGTRWLEREERTAEIHRIDALYLKDDASYLVGMLRESVRAVLWAGTGVTIGEPDIETGTLTAILPRSAQERVSDLIGELRRQVPSGPPARELDSGTPRLLDREVDGVYEDWTVRDAAWDLARQARVTIAFDSLEDTAKRPGKKVGARRVTLDVGRVRLGGALAALAREAGFLGYVLEPPGAVWLYETAPPPRTSQCMWQAAQIRSYEVGMLDALHGFTGPMLVHLVRKRVFPDRWDDPFVMLGFSRARGRLVVIHHEEVQRAVAALLDRLAREGQEALEE